MSRYLGGFWLCIAALVLACGVGEAAAADKKKPKVRPPLDVKVAGVITKVSADEKLITVATGPAAKGEKAPPTQDVKLDDKTVVEYVGINNQDEKKLTKGYTVTCVMGMNNV